MTEQPRHVPTPADLVARTTTPRCGTPLTGAATPTCVAPVPAAQVAEAPPATPPYERMRWEAEVLRRRLHHSDTLVALVLAHYAGPGGVLPQDGIQRTERLREVTRTSSEAVRVALRNLTKARLIERLPYSAGASPAAARAIVLTVLARRERPPHPGERP